VSIINLWKLQDLLSQGSQSSQVCISLYMPTHPVGRAQQQDPIRFKNLLSKAQAELEKRGLRLPEINALIEPAENLLNDQTFWQHQDQGLAIFMAEGVFESYPLPFSADPLVVVADNFHIKPLLPLVSGDENFYILALSQNEIRLLHCDRMNVTEVELENVPTSLQEALRMDDPERQFQFHTGTAASSGSAGTRPAIFHGQGAPDDGTKIDILRYFQKVNRGLMALLRDEQVPLVLAGVDYLIPIYRVANDYHYLIEESITGNPEELSAQQLHQSAWRLVSPIFQKNLHTSLDRYQELVGANNPLASRQIEEIVPAAFNGRISVLFVTLGKQIWGTYQQDQMTVAIHPEVQSGDQDLLDLAAVQTIMNGGKVYALEPERMPEALIAAIFRFTYQSQGS
jgi:hypothetical protein